jgi:hypothetical protein
MVGYSLAPTEYSPPREVPRMALAMLVAVGVIGLWRGFVHEFNGQRVTAPRPLATTAVRPTNATPLPAISAADLTPPPAAASAAKPAPTAAPTAAAEAAASTAAEPETSAADEPLPPAPTPAADAALSPDLGPQPTLQVLDKTPSDTDDSPDKGDNPPAGEDYD